jgi:hypothetical protein
MNVCSALCLFFVYSTVISSFLLTTQCDHRSFVRWPQECTTLSDRYRGDAVRTERLEWLEWPHMRAIVAIGKQSSIVHQNLQLPVDCCKTEHSAVFYSRHRQSSVVCFHTIGSAMAIVPRYTVLQNVGRKGFFQVFIHSCASIPYCRLYRIWEVGPSVVRTPQSYCS